MKMFLVINMCCQGFLMWVTIGELLFESLWFVKQGIMSAAKIKTYSLFEATCLFQSVQNYYTFCP